MPVRSREGSGATPRAPLLGICLQTVIPETDGAVAAPDALLGGHPREGVEQPQAQAGIRSPSGQAEARRLLRLEAQPGDPSVQPFQKRTGLEGHIQSDIHK